jgi:proteasome assembly chaperone (PAC2) family protein
MKSLGAISQKQIIPIVGMAGLMPGLSRLYGGNGCCILVETSGEAIDSTAVGRLIQLLEDYLGFKVNKDKMFKKAKEMLERIKKLNERIAKEQEQIALQEQEAQLQELALSGASAEKKDLGYIR